MLTARAVADRIGIRPSSVCRLMSEGRLPGAKIAGQWRVDSDVLESFLRDAQHSAPSPKHEVAALALQADVANPFA